MTVWIVHVVGESDLGLDSNPERRLTGEQRDELIQQRIAELDACDSASSISTALLGGEWASDPVETMQAPVRPPLAAVLDVLGHAPAQVILVCTAPGERISLPTERIANAIERALARVNDPRVDRVRVARTKGMAEAKVIAAIRSELIPMSGDSALITWGSGSTGLAMASITAVVQRALPWQLVSIERGAVQQIVNPLQDAGIEATLALLMRWRMFATVEDLAGRTPPVLPLTEDQQQVITKLAGRVRDGYLARSAEALRAVAADAVVRRDGTQGFPLRRFIEVQYRDMLLVDRIAQPDLLDLLEWANGRGGQVSLVDLLRRLDSERLPGDVRSSLASTSGNWLRRRDVKGLANFGKRSHQLGTPTRAMSIEAGRMLLELDADAELLTSMALPPTRVAPATRVLVVCIAGLHMPGRVQPSLSSQLLTWGLGPTLLAHVDRRDESDSRLELDLVVLEPTAESTPVAHALVTEFTGVTPNPRSRISNRTARSITLFDREQPGTPADPEQLISAVLRDEIGDDVAALLLLPTGKKVAVLPALRAMQREASRRGLPLFVRELDTTNSGPPGMHLWPALAGGDAALLIAARAALANLEFDTAWRLLAATGHETTIGARARQLGQAFACRQPAIGREWPDGVEDPAPTSDLAGRSRGMAVQRLQVVRSFCEQTADPGQRARALVLASTVVETSVRTSDPKAKERGQAGEPGEAVFGVYRQGLLSGGALGGEFGEACRMLWVLHKARDQSPITHGPIGSPTGPGASPDEPVVRAVGAAKVRFGEPTGHLLHVDSVVTMLDAVIPAAAAIHGSLPVEGHPTLLSLHRRLLADLSSLLGETTVVG